MTEERRKKAAEIAMRRRLGASRQRAAEIKQAMLSQDDLFTTCQKCGEQVSGILADIQQHAGECNGQR